VRQYLRLDPNLPDHKEGYPDGALAAFSLVLCFGEHQPNRGRFRNRQVLAALLGKRARWIDYLLDHKDLVPQDAGVLYIDGWDEWQEGDWKVAERMKRVRERKKEAASVTAADTAAVTPAVTVGVTVPDTPGDTNRTVSGLSEPLAVGGKAVGGRPPAVGRQPSVSEKASKATSGARETPADAIANGQTDDPLYMLAVGMMELLGHPLSGEDQVACQLALNQYAYMSPMELLKRAAEHLDACKTHDPPWPTPHTVAGFSDTWRDQNGWLADHGSPKAWRPGPRSRGMSSVGEALRDIAPTKRVD